MYLTTVSQRFKYQISLNKTSKIFLIPPTGLKPRRTQSRFALSSDYDKTDKAAQMFFAETQNKLLYAVTHKTAAELIISRADATKPNMGLTTWKGSIVRKGDVIIAKNYLQNDELDSLNRLVDIFLTSVYVGYQKRRGEFTRLLFLLLFDFVYTFVKPLYS